MIDIEARAACGYEHCAEPQHDAFGLCEAHSERRLKVLLEKRRFRIPCEACGRETATVERGVCARCVAMAPCVKCGKPRQKTATTGLCGVCFSSQFPPRITECTICGGGVHRENKTGKCRLCAQRLRYGKIKETSHA